jgi:hypothetical protein
MAEQSGLSCNSQEAEKGNASSGLDFKVSLKFSGHGQNVDKFFARM